MKTWLNVFLVLQVISLFCVLSLAMWGVYDEYTNRWKKRKSLWKCIKFVFTDVTILQMLGIGFIIMLFLSIMFTKLILIFNFLEKL